MKENKKVTDNHAFIVDFALFWVVFGWLAFACTLLDLFYAWIFVTYFLLAGSYFIATILKRKRVIRFSSDFVVANILILVSVFTFSMFVTPTVFSGRDQGSLSNAAINLAQNHELEFSTAASKEFFAIYGKGKALNFPGFHYTENGNLTTQFPLGYISWIGAFYSIFGLTGLIIGNAVCLYLFLLSLYIIGKKLLKIRYSALMILFCATSFAFVWFFKFTLSENLALALLWTMILSILYMKKRPDGKSLALYLLSATLLVFTRIEGYAFLITSILVVLYDKNIRDFILANKKSVSVFGIFFIGFFAINFAKNMPFFVEIGKVLQNFFPASKDEINEPSSVVSAGIRMLQIHTLYGLSLFLFFGAIGMARAFMEKSKIILVPLLVAFPSLIYIIDSNISSDHPWMLRRFAFAVLPLFIFYATYLLKTMFEKNPQTSRSPFFLRYAAGAISITILFVNLGSFSRYAFYSEDQGLLEQTGHISKKFSQKDLVAVDRMASENGWSMIAGPLQSLFQRQAVYLTNPSDLAKIDASKFENIFLITSKNNLPYYAGTKIGPNLEIYDRYKLETTRLMEKKNGRLMPLISYPQKETVQTEGYILKYEK